MKKHKIIATSSLIAILPMVSSAATIAWAPSVNMFAGGNNNSFISQNGDFVLGFNGGTTAITTTVGTSVFTTTTSAGINTGISGTGAYSGVSVSADHNNDSGPTTFNDGEFTGAATGVFNLINSAVYGHASGLNTLSLSGLTIGNTYEMQILVNDARGGTATGIRDIEWQVGFNDGNAGTTNTGLAALTNRPFNDSSDPNLAGDYIIGTFTADATTQTFMYGATRGNAPADEFDLGDTLTSPNSGQSQINAFQLRETAVVPEPSSTALLGLGGLALILRRRK